MYKQYWLKSFDYKGVSNVTELIICLMINLGILLLIHLLGYVVPVSKENLVVTLYYIVLVLMIFPTIAMGVRIWNSNKS
ncbi:MULTISPECIES: hypothetical protein [unclassified Staphylococcus]|uniref:hypothetical protein n=1 Tax=unclassified Staphylococcus TaxID=91994 RepID=UPI0021D1E39C|nr:MULTISPECIES: hypothetical protein [unclassified Staphylococcus]UXR68840.1 hypothetical protein MUA26_06550 [Staphylococcus sp. IVB6246]UXR70897.1 hypothetical protein MUA88_06630 [Staphylococcus sp. IVB6240]UXR73127.1 hypothetical protein MUA48_06805 [Staphylococcus sp. IVB6238]UXR75423.1 hypothetical protein MUA74_06865 [Staphylococcus sp. IVB6233]UXR79626.1 hypothetical protein MUA65_06470 [Staphylococcus sp. IVB6218]